MLELWWERVGGVGWWLGSRVVGRLAGLTSHPLTSPPSLPYPPRELVDTFSSLTPPLPARQGCRSRGLLPVALRLGKIPSSPPPPPPGVREVEVSSRDDLLRFIAAGSAQRTTGATLVHTASSRSHALFTLRILRRLDAGADVITSKVRGGRGAIHSTLDAYEARTSSAQRWIGEGIFTAQNGGEGYSQHVGCIL
eukprot:scaffold13876_cov94-Isochrysis_galbana.AAC.2